jgi:hypothetical protein
MKYTLLDMTQTILSSMDSDEVNSINDSTESLQVAKIIKTAYSDILTRANLPEHYSLVSLEASGDSDKPVLMTLPDTVAEILWLKYDKATTDDTDIQMRQVDYKPLDEFLNDMHNLDASDTIVDTFTHTIGDNTITFLYVNDKAPSYYTTFDDYTVIFDSYDNTVDTTLQKSKTLAYAKNVIPFTMSDTFTPDLDEQQFNLLLNEAKSLAWAELKQAPHQKAEASARRGWTNLQSSKFRTERQSFFDRLPNYGRK